MKNNAGQAASILGLVIIAAVAYYGLISLVDLALADKMLEPYAFSDDAASQIVNTLGQSISLVGTILAVILAINALRASKSQGTLTAIEVFKVDFDEFVNQANELYRRFLAILEAATEFAASAEQLKGSIKSSVYDLESESEKFNDDKRSYRESRRKFQAAIHDFHDYVASAGNQFIFAMISENVEKRCVERMERLSRHLKDNETYSGVSEWTMKLLSRKTRGPLERFQDLRELASLSSLRSLHRQDELLAENGDDLVDRLVDRRDDLESLYRVVAVEHSSNGRLPETQLLLLAEYLPTIATQRTYKDGLVQLSNEDGEGFPVLAHDLYAYSYPSERHFYVLDREERELTIPLYREILPIYSEVVNPEAGMERLVNFLLQMGCEEEMVMKIAEGYRMKLSTKRPGLSSRIR